MITQAEAVAAPMVPNNDCNCDPKFQKEAATNKHYKKQSMIQNDLKTYF